MAPRDARADSKGTPTTLRHASPGRVPPSDRRAASSAARRASSGAASASRAASTRSSAAASRSSSRALRCAQPAQNSLPYDTSSGSPAAMFRVATTKTPTTDAATFSPGRASSAVISAKWQLALRASAASSAAAAASNAGAFALASSSCSSRSSWSPVNRPSSS